MSEWQPIETAPKDGTLVLICSPNPDGGMWLDLAMWGQRPYGEGDGWIDAEGVWSCETEEVTHWMHIPEPPAP